MVKNSQLLLQHSTTSGLTSLKFQETEESIGLLHSTVYFLYHFIEGKKETLQCKLAHLEAGKKQQNWCITPSREDPSVFGLNLSSFQCKGWIFFVASHSLWLLGMMGS